MNLKKELVNPEGAELYTVCAICGLGRLPAVLFLEPRLHGPLNMADPQGGGACSAQQGDST